MGETVKQTPYGENILEVESPKSPRIKTLDQLLKAGNVDKAVWEVVDFTLNKWEVGAKDDNGEIAVAPLFQVKARLRRRKMIAQFPTIAPIKVDRTSITHKKPKYKRRDGVETALILPDAHFGFRRHPVSGALDPFHDMRALDVVLQIAYELRPHKVVYLGDILDLPDFSRFPTTPDMQQLTQHAVIAAHWWLGQMRDAAPGAVNTLLEGNHDQRIERAILDHLKAAYDLRPADQLDLPPALSVPRLLALHELGVQYQEAYPNGEYYLADDLMCLHGTVARKGGGKTVSVMVSEYDVSTIQGHNHRIERASRTKKTSRETIAAYSLGCLCHTDGRVPAKFKRVDWQQGFGIAYIDARGGSTVNLYEIRDGACLFGDRVYKGQDRTAVLREASGWPF